MGLRDATAADRINDGFAEKPLGAMDRSEWSASRRTGAARGGRSPGRKSARGPRPEKVGAPHHAFAGSGLSNSRHFSDTLDCETESAFDRERALGSGIGRTSAGSESPRVSPKLNAGCGAFLGMDARRVSVCLR